MFLGTLHRYRNGSIKIRNQGVYQNLTRSAATDAAPVHAVAATMSTNLGNAANNDLTYTAKVAGAAGNSITVAYVISGTGSTATVAVDGNDITVTAGSACTAATVDAAIAASPAADALVAVANKGVETGAGAIAAMAATALTGGSDATSAAAGDTRVDSSYLYVATADVAVSSTSGWKRIALSALA